MKDLSSFGSDGASVMVGSRSGVECTMCCPSPGTGHCSGWKSDSLPEEGERLAGCSMEVFPLLLSVSSKSGGGTASHAT